MDVLVVAGEVSGDQHTARVIAYLKAFCPKARFFGMGGRKMQAQGVELLVPLDEISVMGISAVIPKLPKIFGALKKLSLEAQKRKPVVALLVDFPDFNTRLAKRLKAMKIPVVWYISPSVWAWRKGRIKTLSKVTDSLLCILPFEPDFYKGSGVNTHFVGNPIAEQMPSIKPQADFKKTLGLSLRAPLLALVPGSRRMEIHRMLPVFVKAANLIAKHIPRLEIVIPLSPNLPQEMLAPHLQKLIPPYHLRSERLSEVVATAHVALVTSGTASLETALMRIPMVVAYRMSFLNWCVAKCLIRIKHFSLPNLAFGKPMVPELAQFKATPRNLAAHALALWEGEAREKMLEQLEALAAQLGATPTSLRVAEHLLHWLKPPEEKLLEALANSPKTAVSPSKIC
ncbi:MAG: lipid-A-disaccharide synthase [Cystobacterineae bacterium]|nr:lipid-A-disaccharide synthase [Cystobacterineae bacterium]